MSNNYLKIKCKLFECYDIDGEIIYTFDNKISYVDKNDLCIPIIKSKYNDNSFIKLAFTKLFIEKHEEIKHLINIQNWDEGIAKEYFVNYENYHFSHKEIELYVFLTKEDYNNLNISNEYYCILEDYFINLPVLRGNLILDYEYGNNIQWNLWFLEKITCNTEYGLLQFHSVDNDINEIYIEDFENSINYEISKIKDELIDLGIDKELLDKYSNKCEINFKMIKIEILFNLLKLIEN